MIASFGVAGHCPGISLIPSLCVLITKCCTNQSFTVLAVEITLLQIGYINNLIDDVLNYIEKVQMLILII